MNTLKAEGLPLMFSLLLMSVFLVKALQIASQAQDRLAARHGWSGDKPRHGACPAGALDHPKRVLGAVLLSCVPGAALSLLRRVPKGLEAGREAEALTRCRVRSPQNGKRLPCVNRLLWFVRGDHFPAWAVLRDGCKLSGAGDRRRLLSVCGRSDALLESASHVQPLGQEWCILLLTPCVHRDGGPRSGSLEE